jgi:hypothetical protein
VITETTAPVDSGGTMWRLRSLVAMGHDAGRIAHALTLSPRTIEKILGGQADAVSPELRDLVRQLWDAWWDKRPPEQSRSERRAAGAARRRAKRCGWCPPLGLDEDELDQPGYRPYSRYREAMGTGTSGSSPRKPAREPARGRHDRDPPAGHTAITGRRAATTTAAAA